MNCTSTDLSAGYVFPNAVIPPGAFSLPATKTLRFIPTPNIGTNQFSSRAEKRRTDDDKSSARIDLNDARYGNVSGSTLLANPFGRTYTRSRFRTPLSRRQN